MPRFIYLAFCTLAFSLASASAQEKASPEQVNQLIQKMGQKDFRQRAAAMRKLEAMGPSILPTLKKSVDHTDVEVRTRVRQLVTLFESKIEMSPKLVTLKVKHKTIRQILDDIKAQTGYEMEYWGDVNDQEVFTFDLDKVPFWQAMDAVSRATRMVPLGNYGDARLQLQREQGFPAHIAYGGAFRFVPVSLNLSKTLQFGREGDHPQPSSRTENMSLSFFVFAEPKLPLLSVGEVLLTEAEDSEKNSMLPDPPGLQPGGNMAFRQTARYGNGYPQISYQVSMPLKRVSEKATTAKFLRGEVPVTLLVEQKQEVVTDKMMEAKGKKMTVGTTSFNVEEITDQKNGQYMLKMHIAEKDNPANDYTWINSMYRRLDLLDEAGNKFQLFGSGWSHSDASSVTVNFTYGSPGAKMGKPTKLLFHTWKTMQYQVKFEFKDLPLP